MAALWRLISSALAAELGVWRDHARRRAGLVLALLFFVGIALLLALGLAVAALALWIGPVAALAVALGIAILLCLILLILLQIEARGHARRAAAQATRGRRLREPALGAALVGRPAASRRGAVVGPEHLAPLAPIDDVRGSADYRRDAALTLVCRALDELGSMP